MKTSDASAPGDAHGPDVLDALKAAADYHILLFENDQVRVLDTIIAAGDSVPLHSHRWPSVMHVMSFSDFVRYDEAGNVLLDSRKLSTKPQPGEAMWAAPLPPHTLKNVGSSDLRVITVELKNSADR